MVWYCCLSLQICGLLSSSMVSVELRHGISSEANWGYKHGLSFKSPNHWSSLPNSHCGGQRQSPIDIRTNHVMFKSDLEPILIKKIDNIDTPVSVDKHATSMYIGFNANWQISFGKSACLRPVALHWHWGSDDSHGSEHRINGKQYPIEAHLVSYNCDLYQSFVEASTKPNGLYVIGFFYQIGPVNNILNEIWGRIDPIIQSGEEFVPLREINPRYLLPHDISNYYRYEGSLTTPPCTENVIWTVLKDVQPISEHQLASFRKLKFGSPESGPMVNNYRPFIPIETGNDCVVRVVYSSFPNDNVEVRKC